MWTKVRMLWGLANLGYSRVSGHKPAMHAHPSLLMFRPKTFKVKYSDSPNFSRGEVQPSFAYSAVRFPMNSFEQQDPIMTTEVSTRAPVPSKQ